MTLWKDVLEPIIISFVVGIFGGVAVMILRGIRKQKAAAKKLQLEGVVTQGTIIRKWTQVYTWYSSSDHRNHSRTAKLVHYSFYGERDGKKMLVTMPSTEMYAPEWDTFVDGCAVDVKHLPNDSSVHDLVPNLDFILSGQAHFWGYLLAGSFGLASFVFTLFLVPGKAWYVILGTYLGWLLSIGLVQIIAAKSGCTLDGSVGRFGAGGDVLHNNDAEMTDASAPSKATDVEVSDSENHPLMNKIVTPANKPADGIVSQLFRCCSRTASS